jgi:hypothetical protein
MAEEIPLLLIDVDGVISLFGFALDAQPPGRFLLVDGIAHLLSATAGDHLRRLSDAFDPVWCTGWEEKANDYLPHALGLPGPYPYLSFEQPAGGVRPTRAHWKLDAIEAYVGTRPLAWIDDAHDARCVEWARARAQAGAPTLLVPTDPAIGLTEQDVMKLTMWRSGLCGEYRPG